MKKGGKEETCGNNYISAHTERTLYLIELAMDLSVIFHHLLRNVLHVLDKFQSDCYSCLLHKHQKPVLWHLRDY